jgi:hypothetical protein
MSSSSSKLLVALIGLAAACAPLEREGVVRRPFERMDPDGVRPVTPVDDPEEELFPDIGNLTACDWVALQGGGGVHNGRFRLMGKAKPVESADDLIPPDGQNNPLDFLRFWDGTKIDRESSACKKVRKGNSEAKVIDQCYRDRAEAARKRGIELNRVWGRVDMGANPLYQYSFVYVGEEEIPNETDFLKTVDDLIAESKFKLREDSSSPYTTFSVPALFAFRQLMRFGVMDPVQQRNKIVQSEFNKYFPGAFRKDGVFRIKESFPEAIFKNGSPAFDGLAPLPDDSAETVRKKIELVNGMFGVYERELPLFTRPTWDSFREDMRSGLTAAIRGMNSKSPVEQACGTTLLHRSFGQLLTVMGYDRTPVSRDSSTGQTSLPSIDELAVDTPKGVRMRVCKSPGSFVRGGRRVSLGRDELMKLSENASSYSLSRAPFLPDPCRETVVRDSEAYIDDRGPQAGAEKISAQELLEFVSGTTYYSMAFNPAAKWWKNGLPLASFSSLKGLVASGGVLPALSHALSLAYLQLGFSSFQDHHLVLIDAEGRETVDESTAMGARISETAHEMGSGGRVVTTARSAALLAEFAFRLSRHLEKLSGWYDFAKVFVVDEERRIRSEMAERLRSERLDGPDGDLNGPKKKLKEEIVREATEALLKNRTTYDSFMGDMFGDESNLVTLTDASADTTIRRRIEDLKLISSLMLVSFVKRLPDGRYTCYARLDSDLDSGAEEKTGECSDLDSTPQGSTKSLFRQAMKLVAEEYESPIFREFSR